jgi:hypothetical protein
MIFEKKRLTHQVTEETINKLIRGKKGIIVAENGP